MAVPADPRPQLTSLGPETRRSWRLLVDGQEVHASEVVLLSERFGVWTYGRHPRGYDAWWFRENGGGGVVSLPYTIDANGELWVGLVWEERPNMGPGRHLCAIGGFLDKNTERHDEANRRELEEEAGILTAPRPLIGAPLNSNRAFFVADAEQDEGVHPFAILVDAADLTNGEGERRFVVVPRSTEGLDLVFLPWRDAVRRCSDALALAAIARLFAELR